MQTEPRASQPFLINQTGTLLRRHLAQFVSAIDNSALIETGVSRVLFPYGLSDVLHNLR